ncbi:hypothetical protein Mapa_016411 [Marchantia paleacea]|nr:hypothetical protein Mapa_016411 [Marchantia paleacea]
MLTLLSLSSSFLAHVRNCLRSGPRACSVAPRPPALLCSFRNSSLVVCIPLRIYGTRPVCGGYSSNLTGGESFCHAFTLWGYGTVYYNNCRKIILLMISILCNIQLILC